MAKDKKRRISDPNFVLRDRWPFTGASTVHVSRNDRKRYAGVIINESPDTTITVQIESMFGYYAPWRTLAPGASIEIRDFPLSIINFRCDPQCTGIFTVMVWSSEKPHGFVRTTVPVSVTVTPAGVQQVDIEQVLGAPVSAANPLFTDPIDRAARLLGVVDSLTKWGGTALTGRNISLDLALLQPASAIGTLADVTAAAAPTQIVVASTPCKSVIVESLAANTGTIRIGDSNVSATRGVEMSKGDAAVIDVDNVNKVYVFGNATDKVSVTYVN